MGLFSLGWMPQSQGAPEQDGRPDPAALADALRQNPDNEELLFNAGMTAHLAEDYPLAIEHWERLIRLNPADWQTRRS